MNVEYNQSHKIKKGDLVMNARKRWFISVLLILGLILVSCAPQSTAAPTQPAATTAPTQPATTTAPTQPPATTAPTQPPATVAPTKPAEEVTISVWLMPLVDDDAKELAPYIQDFEQKNPGIKVDLTIIPWSNSLQAQITAFKGGVAPDVLYTSPNRIIALEAVGAIAPLEGYANDAYKAKLKPDILNAGYWKGHLYGVPFTSYGRALYYNIDDFKKAGIDTPPTNWDEFRADAKKLTGNGVYGFSLSGTDDWMDDYRLWLYQAGGQWLSDDNTKCMVNSPAGVEAFSFLVDMAVKDKSMYPGSGASTLDNFQLFSSGSTAMWIQSTYLAKLKETAPDLNFGTADIPQYGKGHPDFGLGEAEWLSIASSSQHKDQAWKFLEYYTSDPYFQLHHNIDITFLPVIPMPDFPIDDARMKPFIDDTSLPLAPVVMHPDALEITALIRGELNKAFLGEIGVKEALDNACAAVDKLLATK
jgi:multiple sugar transport system substrate-binding protein